jgi:hypothetical protein
MSLLIVKSYRNSVQPDNPTVRSMRMDMGEMYESYRRIGDTGEDRFDIDFWQSQGAQTIFSAALDMIQDYHILRYGHAHKPGLQRTVEHFGKA